jgi:hypothetical protein
MSFLRRLLGMGQSTARPATGVQVMLPVQGPGANDELAAVTVGGASLPAVIYRDYERDDDWTSGIRLEHPVTGRWLLSDDEYPDSIRAAGGRATAVVGLPYHPDAQRTDFEVGRFVRLVPEPTNPVNPAALAVRSWDGRYLAGYVPDDDLAKVRAAVPAAVMGLVVWERWTSGPRVRRSLRILVGPTVGLTLVPAEAVPAEQARREALFAAGTDAERAAREAARVAAHEAKAAAHEAERERRHAQRLAEHEQRVAQANSWKTAGLCVDCGAPVEPTTGARGRPPIRCELHGHRAIS